MKSEEAKKIADNALQQLSDALASGKSEQLTAYLSMMAKFHQYSWGNCLMILSQMPSATHIAGFNAWKQFGRWVKKGEKGIVIIAPMTIKPKEGQINPDAAPGQETKPFLRFKAAYVFDVSQTEGQPLPENSHVTGDPSEYLPKLHQLIASHGITLDQDDIPMGAFGVSRGGRISIRAGLSPAETFSVTVHELAHELLHKAEDSPKAKTIRETEAEAVAFVVCMAVGLTTGTASADYIQLYDGKPETLAASLSRIQHMAAEIIAAVKAEAEEPSAA